jgi:hypothetical protein
MAAPKKTAAKAPVENKVVATVNTETALAEQKAADAANANEVVASDVLIPRLLLMQGISPLVTSRKAQIGDMIRSTTGEKLGNPDKGFDIVPIKMSNSWISFEKVPGENQPQFRGQEHRGAMRDNAGHIVGTNEDLPWEFKGPQGQEMFRRKAITLYALVPGDVAAYQQEIDRAIESGEAPDLNKTVMPVVLTFQSTSFKHAGKSCASFFNSVRVNASKMAGKMTIAPFQYTMTLNCKEEKKGKNAWFVFSLDAPKSLKDAGVREEAARWSGMLATNAVRVDDNADITDEGTQGSTGASEMEV